MKRTLLVWLTNRWWLPDCIQLRIDELLFEDAVREALLTPRCMNCNKKIEDPKKRNVVTYNPLVVDDGYPFAGCDLMCDLCLVKKAKRKADKR